MTAGKLFTISVVLLLIVTLIVSGYYISRVNLDPDTDAARSRINTIGEFFGKINFTGSYLRQKSSESAKSIRSNLPAYQYPTLQADSPYTNFTLSFTRTSRESLNMNSKSVIRIIFPVTASGVAQYGWNMTPPDKISGISANVAENTANVRVGKLGSHFLGFITNHKYWF